MQNKVLTFCNSRLEVTNGLFVEYALSFTFINTIAYLFFIKEDLWCLSAIHFVGCSLCIILLTKDVWDRNLQEFIGIYWYTTLLVCLPLPNFLSFLLSSLAPDVVMSTVLSLFMLSILVDWLMFIVLLLVGFLGALVIALNINPESIELLLQSQYFVEVIYMMGTTIIINAVFLRKQSENFNIRFKVSRSIAGILCHELNTPLATINLMSQALKKEIKSEISNQSVLHYLDKVIWVIKDITGFMDNTISKLQDNAIVELEKLYVLTEIDSILAQYCFKDDERSKIYIDVHNFAFLGDKNLFKHTLLNLIKNSLYYMEQKPGTIIKISSSWTEDMNVLVFEDTGIGIDPEKINKIFSSFFTTKNTGTGLGLYFCKKVLQKFGGYITCESELNNYTRFKLFFPK